MKKLFLIVFLFIILMPTFAQPRPNTKGDGGNVTGNAIGNSVPVDGGIVVLLALGGVYGLYRKYKRTE